MSNRSNGPRSAAETIISPSSSITLVTPAVRDDVGIIAERLGDVDKIINNIDLKSAGSAYDKKDLLGEISKLSEDVGKIKLEQASQIKAIRADVKRNTKTQVSQSVQGHIQSLISETIAARVQQEIAEWGSKPGVNKFTRELRTTVDRNDALLGEARVELENLRARHANSTLDIYEDRNIGLTVIKCKDGQVSQVFPRNLEELLSYETEQLLQFLKEYDLRPLEKHTENLNRVLAFIGVNGSIPDQVLNSPDEEPPAYKNATETRDERNPRPGTRRGASQDVKQSTRPSWPWG